MKLTQENFDNLVSTLNHRVTKLETHAHWIKWLLGAVLITNVTKLFI